jgi:nitrite reductase/ring-hydroxylating ferredoxin subunit
MQEKFDRILLCKLDQIRVPGSRGLTVACGDLLQDIFLVRSADGVYGYINSCPHTGAPLDWMPDQFLSLDEAYIQCSTHAALFNLHDGTCIAGPCSGDALKPIPLLVESGAVFMLLREFCSWQQPARQS